MKHAGFQHDALIYQGREEYLEGTVPFLLAGLEAGEPALVAVGPEQTELIEAELGEGARAVRFAEMRELGRNPAGIVSLWRQFVDDNGGRRVRGIGEPVWSARSPAALEECRRHESLLNVAFAPEPAWSLLCPYDAGSLADDVLEEVADSHRHLHRGGEVVESDRFDPDRDCFAGDLPAPQGEVRDLAFALGGLREVREWRIAQ